MNTASNRVSFLGSVSFGWIHAHGGFAFDEPYFLDPMVHLEREQAIHEFVAKMFPDDPIYNVEAHLVQIQGRQKPVALVGAIQPNLILGVCVGAQFVFYGDKDPDITQSPLADLRDVSPLWNIDWADTWPTGQFLDQIHDTRTKVGDTHTIVPPFFWDTSGRVTIHGILTTAQKLLGERIFLELMDNPSFVSEFFAWITDAYIKQVRLCADAAGMKINGIHIGDCSLCMVGPDPFVEFVLPHVNKLAAEFGPVRFHSCGRVDHLLEGFSLIDNLHIINVGSDTTVAKIRDRFPLTRIDLTPETKLLTKGTTDDIDAWVRRIVAENGEGELEIQGHLDYAQPQANCLQINRTLQAMGITCERIRIY